MKPKYIFDIKRGHFIKQINEEDTTQNTPEIESEEKTEDSQEKQNSFKSVENNEKIQEINAKISAETEKFNRESDTQQKLLDQAKAAASEKNSDGIYDPVETDSNVLNIRKKMNDLKKQHYTTLVNLEDQRLQVLSSLATANESVMQIPEKYKFLNESNIHIAKIYMGDLVGQESTKSILKGMSDFKRTFADTTLLYGKDRNGYFLIILDQEDMDVMYDTLDKVGYLRDDIIDTVMPQLFNRTHLIS